MPCLESSLGPPDWFFAVYYGNRFETLDAGIPEADTYIKCLMLELQVVDPVPGKARWGPSTPGHGQSAILEMPALDLRWHQVRQGGCIGAKTLSPPQPPQRKFQQRVRTPPPCLKHSVPQLRLVLSRVVQMAVTS